MPSKLSKKSSSRKRKAPNRAAVAAAAVIASFSLSADAEAAAVSFNDHSIQEVTIAADLSESITADYTLPTKECASMAKLGHKIDSWLKQKRTVLICIKTGAKMAQLCTLRPGEKSGFIQVVTVGPKESLPKGAILLLPRRG